MQFSLPAGGPLHHPESILQFFHFGSWRQKRQRLMLRNCWALGVWGVWSGEKNVFHVP